MARRDLPRVFKIFETKWGNFSLCATRNEFMEEITLKKLSDEEILDFYDRAVVQLPRELVRPLTSIVVELFQRREKDESNKQRKSFLSSFALVDKIRPTAKEIEDWMDDVVKKDLFDSLGYIPKDYIEYVKEDEI